MGDIDTATEARLLFGDGPGYFDFSTTQRLQGRFLVGALPNDLAGRVLDVGCGSGNVTLELLHHCARANVLGIDVSPSMIERAERLLGRDPAIALRASLQSVDFLRFASGIDTGNPDRRNFDAIFSTSALHWLGAPRQTYAALHRVLRPGGLLAVHQGATGCYAELHEIAQKAHVEAGLGDAPLRYPPGYLSAEELVAILDDAGFVAAQVHELDYTLTGRGQLDALAHDFAHAGLLPYLPETERSRTAFRERFFDAADALTSVRVRRLYAVAERGSSGSDDGPARPGVRADQVGRALAEQLDGAHAELTAPAGR
ncbi:class I SAM-dependent methyltransferase [Antribacter gilvus]|uniref:class I SAM-dependent methyltransferase n=1 Tax=Antribacter gilvus TaxID=2304675 RepID=UPI001F0B8098|nr:class I SAM-dependent methyltransferase [Antribacter gilvus]